MAYEKKPTANKRTELQKEADRAFCSNLYLQGVPYRDIADRLNKHNAETLADKAYHLSYTQVFLDLKAMLVEKRKETEDTLDEIRYGELLKLDKIESEGWLAWERSKTGRKKAKIKKRGSDNDETKKKKSAKPDKNAIVTESSTETSDGNPRYMEIVLKAMSERRLLLGLNDEAPRRKEVKEQAYDPNDMPLELREQFTKWAMSVPDLPEQTDIPFDNNVSALIDRASE